MSTRILVPVDRSSQSTAGLVYALESFPDATIIALHVVDVGYDNYASVGTGESLEEVQRRAGDRILERATEVASAVDRAVDPVLETGIPHRTIVEYAVEHDIDHVVMGSHGTSPIVRPFLGHVSEAVVRRVPVSTTIVPESRSALEQRTLPGRILAPVDGSAQSLAALEYAASQFPDGEITILHAVSLPFEYDLDAIEGTYLEPLLEQRTERGEAILEGAADAVEDTDASIDGTELVYGTPDRAIVDYALEHEYDQIIMGSHGRSLPARIITGSIAETVARRSPIPVTLVSGQSS